MDPEPLRNCKGRFPFKLATTSYIYPDQIIPNVGKIGPYLDEIELVLFESKREDDLPDEGEITALINLSSRLDVGFNIHLPIDIYLGDENEGVRSKGVSIVKEVFGRTLRLNPSVYTLHLDLKNPPVPPFIKGGRRGDFPKGSTGRSVREEDLGGWRVRLLRSMEEILECGIETRRISIETLGYPFEWIEDIVRKFDFSICLDVGHLLVNGLDLPLYFRKYLSDTSIIHLHGVENGTDHLGVDKLENGIIDRILSQLQHYRGIVSIEVFSFDDLKRSLEVLEEKWGKR